MKAVESVDAFSLFSKPVRRAIRERGFLGPTEPQEKAIPLILEGKSVLLVAPTGSGKTEAAFLPILDSLCTMQERSQGIRALYITPLRALNRDILERLEWWCKALDIRLAVRHGDTEARERGRQALAPPDILITTPETLQAVLSGPILRRHLRSVRWAIVDEVHELAGDKRGSQLSMALERLRHITEGELQLVGLSATIGTPEEVARFLVGANRPCEVSVVPVARLTQLSIAYPRPEKEDYELASKLYTYPEVACRLRVIRGLVEEQRSVLVFTNTRTEAEVLASRFRVWDSEFPLGVHHGSLSRPSRVSVEREFKDGRLQAIVCTSSLEMGIDIGLLEMVVQYNSPRQVTRLLQRVGRSGHRIRGIAKGVIITQDSDDALEALVIARRALLEDLEPVKIQEKPFDPLAHQIAGLLLHKARWGLEEALELLRRAYPYRGLSEDELMKVLKYMSERRPRLAWLSLRDRVLARPLSIKEFYRYYFENLSMIPEERQYLVVEEDGSPVGLLDEAFVAEHGEIGIKFVERGSIWRIAQIYGDKIYVRPESDPTGAIPTWVGEEIPVPYEVAAEVGSIRGLVEERLKAGASLEEVAEGLSRMYPADGQTIARALLEVKEQVERGQPIPTDGRITIERWMDYVIVQCCFGHLANRTLSRILGYVLSQKVGAPIGVQQDPYRVILNLAKASPEEVRDMLVGLAGQDIRELAVQAIIKSRAFKRRIVQTAKKFGALAKDAELSGASLEALIEGLKGTAVYDEAINTALFLDADVEKAGELLRRISSGEIEVELVGPGGLTPVARIGLEEIGRRSDIIPPERMKRVLVESVRARILSEARTLVCMNCWDTVETARIRSLIRGWSCPSCGSSKVGITDESEERMRLLCERVHAGHEVPKRFRRPLGNMLRSAELYQSYGFPALFVLGARGIRPSEARGILKSEGSYNDHLVELVMAEERRALKRRYFG